MTNEHHKHAAQLLAELSPADRAELLLAADNEVRHAAERAKSHPILAGRFTAQEKAALKLYLLDGGGVRDDEYLRKIVLQAILDDDWLTVFREMPHVIKNWINLRAGIVVAKDGMVAINGYGPTPKSPRGVPNGK